MEERLKNIEKRLAAIELMLTKFFANLSDSCRGIAVGVSCRGVGEAKKDPTPIEPEIKVDWGTPPEIKVETEIEEPELEPEEVEITENDIGDLGALLESPLEKNVKNPKEFEELKKLLDNAVWPNAIDAELVCDLENEQDKEDRAEGIIDLILDINLKGLSFLDFGCGEGHITHKILEQEVSKSVGYDIVKNERWDRFETAENFTLTDDWEKVVENGPYDIILLYDVIDHIMGTEDDVIKNLKKLRNVMRAGSQVFVRCHPFCSRHGTHMYQKKNKAYMHLIFTPDELKELGYEETPTRRIIHPLMTYKHWFKTAGFQLYKRDHVYKEAVEPFFENVPLVAQRIKGAWKNSPEPQLKEGKIFPRMQLEQQFVDYILK